MSAFTRQEFSLYVHIPWCVQKCPYCDFNSHRLHSDVDAQHYLSCLLEDLQQELGLYSGRILNSIFIGGGTPSLMTAEFYTVLIDQIKQLTACSENLEITLEANPGTVDSANFAGFHQAGINRLSIGVQSFQNQQLRLLGRIHDQQQIYLTFEKARQAGFDNINLDLMFALPQQTMDMAIRDLQLATALQPEHLSWYQLTLEPNTAFYANPPADIPDDDMTWEIHQNGISWLEDHHYQQYEISAYSLPGRECRHNLNYWHFGDYAGIGAGAHAKVTLADGAVMRRSKQRSPLQYQQRNYLSTETKLQPEDIFIEYLMNRMRLRTAFSGDELATLSGMSRKTVLDRLQPQVENEYLIASSGYYRVSDKGHQFLNEMLSALI